MLTTLFGTCHGCSSKEIFWGCKGFLPKFSHTCPKSCRATFTDRFFGVTSKNGLHLFICKCLGPFFEVTHRWAPFLPRLSGIFLGYLGILFGFSGILPRFSGILPKFLRILPRFSTIQNFWGCACTPASYTTGTCDMGFGAFHAVTVLCHGRNLCQKLTGLFTSDFSFVLFSWMCGEFVVEIPRSKVFGVTLFDSCSCS